MLLVDKKGDTMSNKNRILLSNITASLLLVSYPLSMIAADATGIVYIGDANETNAAPVTLNDIDSDTRTAIDVQNTVDAGITISNTSTLTVDSENDDVYGIYAESYNDGVISQSGTIDLNSTNGYAAGVYVYETNNGTVNNTGDIVLQTGGGDANGIYSYDNSGTISNGGTIDVNSTDNGNATGIYVENENSGSVTNTGTITATANNNDATGIYAGANLADANITNSSSGVITATSANSSAYGISVGDTNGGEINNLGEITATATLGSAYGIYVNTNDGTINNEGTIYAEGRSDTYGIYADSNNGSITQTNSGSIEATTTDDGGAYGIYTVSNSGTITAAGSIYAHSLNGSTYGIYVDGDNGNAINANGSIRVTSTDGDEATGIYIGGTNSGSITNSGTIVAASTNNDAYGISINDNSGGSITNSGTITAPIAISINSGTGTFTNTSSGIINGDLQMGSTDVLNEGSINLLSNVSTVNDFVQSATGVLGIKLYSGSDGVPSYSKLVANGTITLNAGTTINVNVQTASNYQDLLVNQQLSDVVSAFALNADASTINVTDTSALLNFVPVIDGTTLDLNIVQGVSILDATQNSGFVGAIGAANVLGSYSGNNADLNAFINALGIYETEAEVGHAILETTPTTVAALPTMSTQMYGTMGSIVQSHQNNLRGLNSGDIVFGNKSLWIKPFGSYSKQNDKDGLNGFSAHSKGFGIGMDGEYESAHRIGLAFFYTNTDASTNGISQSTKLDIFNLIGYGNFPIVDNKTNLLYQVGVGIQKTDSSRYISAVNKTASADYNAKSFFTQIKATREMSFNDALSISNELYGTYVYYKNPAYGESGAGGLNLNVKSFNTNTFILGIEENLQYVLEKGTNLIGNVGLGYDFGNTNQSVSASYAGASGSVFDTKGIDNGHWSYKAGAGVSQTLQENLSIDLKYDLEGKGIDFKNHTVSAKMNYKF